MTLPSSGPISIGDIRDEFGGTGARAISTYYRGGSLVPNHESNDDIPTSGLIRLSDFRGTSKNFIATMTSGIGTTFQTVGYIKGSHGSMNFTFVGRPGSSARGEILQFNDNIVSPFGYTNTNIVFSGDQRGSWWNSIVVVGPTTGENSFPRLGEGTYNADFNQTTWTASVPTGINQGLFFGFETHTITMNIV